MVLVVVPGLVTRITIWPKSNVEKKEGENGIGTHTHACTHHTQSLHTYIQTHHTHTYKHTRTPLTVYTHKHNHHTHIHTTHTYTHKNKNTPHIHEHHTHTELPTSTFLPYFVRFLKGNTAVRFFLQKYVFQNFVFFFFFFFFFFFLILESITHIIYVMKTWSEFLNNNVQK